MGLARAWYFASSGCELRQANLNEPTIVPRWKEAQHGQTAAQKADRPLLLADTERLEDLDHARRMPPAVQSDCGEHRARRSIRAGVPEDIAEQPDAGDRRSQRARRPADRGVRVGRDPAVPGA